MATKLAYPQTAPHASRRTAGRLVHDAAGGVLVEATVMMTILFVFILGGIDFLFAFYQYNAATKAVEMGARVAAVWNPVASGLNDLSANAINSGGYTAGGSMPAFDVVCDGAAGSCTCVTGYCAGIGYDSDAMAAIVCGRGATNSTCSPACPASASPPYTTGMCQIYGGIRMANVKVIYTQPSSGGLGYAGRPSGPVPTITVQLQNVPFNFYFLGGLLRFTNITMPPLTTTITGESLSSAPQ
jgi:Flp pilus assembly protein TadG